MSNIESALQWAQNIADGLPAKYQQAAFAELLRHALSSTGTIETGIVQQGSSNLENWQQNLVDNLPPASLASKGSRDQQTMWAIITLLDAGEEATPDSIRKAIQVTLGTTPESRSNTSHRLRKLTPLFAMRQERQAGRGYMYTPTARALEIFEGLGE